jgi:hypothetical protein
MIEVSHDRRVGNDTIEITFNTGESCVVDLAASPWGPVFEPVRRLERFCRSAVSATLQTITWDHDANFAPEYLREKMIKQAAATDPCCGSGPQSRSARHLLAARPSRLK